MSQHSTEVSRVALVTGAARGIGAATVHELCRECYRVVAVDIDVIGMWNTAAASSPHMLDGPDPHGCRFVAVARGVRLSGRSIWVGWFPWPHWIYPTKPPEADTMEPLRTAPVREQRNATVSARSSGA